MTDTEKKVDDFPIARLKNEGIKPYQAFICYAQLGQNRTIADAYLSFKTGQKVDEKSEIRSHWEKWATQYNWVERALEYDQYLAKKALNSIVDCQHQNIEQFHKRTRETYEIAEQTGQVLLKAIATAIKKRTENNKVLEASEAQKWASAYQSICSGSKLNRDLFSELLGLDAIINKINDSESN